MTLDPRQQRTRAALRAALLDLVGDKPFAEVSISEIARHAGIARPTFYLHYREKDEILGDYLTEFLTHTETAFAEVLRGKRGDDARSALPPVFVSMLNRIEREARLFRLVVGGHLGARLREQVRAHQRRVNQMFLSTQDHAELTNVELDLVASFCAGGVMELIQRWLDGGTEIPAWRVAELMGQLLDGALWTSAIHQTFHTSQTT